MSFTLWFTGLSGSGKTTLSRRVFLELKRRGLRVELLDGDIIRTNFGQELGFTKRDRDINVKRIGFVSHLLNKHKVISVVAAIAPYAETRALNRRLIGNYIEIYCACSLEAAIQRDVKGLYQRALAGEIPHFTGVSDPYDIPQQPDVFADTEHLTVEQTLSETLRALEAFGVIEPMDDLLDLTVTEEEELAWRRRLWELGFASSCDDVFVDGAPDT